MWSIWKSRRVKKPLERWDLSTPLLQLSKQDVWTIGNSVEGTLGLGETGSGKSSATAREIALSFLRAGYGGMAANVVLLPMPRQGIQGAADGRSTP